MNNCRCASPVVDGQDGFDGECVLCGRYPLTTLLAALVELWQATLDRLRQILERGLPGGMTRRQAELRASSWLGL